MSDSGLRSFAHALCVVVACLGLPAFSSKHGFAGEREKGEDFARLSGDLGRILERFTWRGLLFEPEFDQLSNLTAQDLDLCVNYIADPKHTRFERYAAGFSAYKLDPSAYAQFVRHLLDLRARGLISTAEIAKITIPPADDARNVIHENDESREIQNLIAAILNLPDLEGWARDDLIFERDHGNFLVRSKKGLAGRDDKREEFARLGREIGLSLDQSITWKGLSHDPEFDQLANLTRGDVDLCVSYIADPTRTRFERYAAGFSAYKLDPSAYAEFVRRLLDLRARNTITTADVIKIITPPINGVPDVIYDNYEQRDIQRLISTLLELPDLEDWARKWLIFESNHGGFFRRMYDRLHALLLKLGYR
jgi:hypothetical protein